MKASTGRPAEHSCAVFTKINFWFRTSSGLLLYGAITLQENTANTDPKDLESMQFGSDQISFKSSQVALFGAWVWSGFGLFRSVIKYN